MEYNPPMTDRQEPNDKLEIEAKAWGLHVNLMEFSSGNTHQRELLLPGLVSLIDETANKDTIGALVDPEFQPKLEIAVSKTFATPFDVDGKEVYPWEEGRTIVAIDNAGNIKGATSVPTSGLEEFGDLHKHALKKAVYGLHLRKRGEEHGVPKDRIDISEPLNNEYLKSKLPGVTIYNGVSQYTAKVGADTIFIGGSGCAASAEYLTGLLGGAIPGPETQAGRLDMVFSDITSFYLEDPNLETSTIVIFPEPNKLRELRLNN